VDITPACKHATPTRRSTYPNCAPRPLVRTQCCIHENSELSAAPNPAQQASPCSRIQQHGAGPCFRSAASICPGAGRALLGADLREVASLAALGPPTDTRSWRISGRGLAMRSRPAFVTPRGPRPGNCETVTADRNRSEALAQRHRTGRLNVYRDHPQQRRSCDREVARRRDNDAIVPRHRRAGCVDLSCRFA
jgi:hypothetical protein